MMGKACLVLILFQLILVRNVTHCCNTLKVPFLRCKQSTLGGKGWSFTAAPVTVAKSAAVHLDLSKCLFII